MRALCCKCLPQICKPHALPMEASHCYSTEAGMQHNGTLHHAPEPSVVVMSAATWLPAQALALANATLDTPGVPSSPQALALT